MLLAAVAAAVEPAVAAAAEGPAVANAAAETAVAPVAAEMRAAAGAAAETAAPAAAATAVHVAGIVAIWAPFRDPEESRVYHSRLRQRLGCGAETDRPAAGSYEAVPPRAM